MTGYHIYYQTKEGQHDIDSLVQLASILNWKKHYGPIKLYCNKRYLETISKYGLDKEYDFIDTDFLETVPYKDYMSKYWSFCKIYLAKHLAEFETEFCILDTDLWIQKPNMLDMDKDLIFYHREAYDIKFPNNPYPLASNWIDNEEFDWSTSPCNCAILCFKSNFKELINTWYSVASEVIERTKDIEFEFENKNANTIFIEQRLLPTIAVKLNVKYGLILDTIYLTFKQGLNTDGDEWAPKLGHSPENSYAVLNIKHIWGLKAYYDFEFIRDIILSEVFLTLEQFPEIEIKYKELIDKYKI
jgi:hypothetical protein